MFPNPGFSVMIKRISSLQNPLVKEFLVLQEKSRERRKTNQMVIEGTREISLAMKSGYSLTALLFCPDILPSSQFLELFPLDPLRTEATEISTEVFNRLAYRKDSGGVIALAEAPLKTLSSLTLPETPLILVLESVEKPGNLGAILRTADAAGVSAIILCDLLTDLFNPNTIRSSLGTIFTNQVAMASTDDAIIWLQEKGINLFAAALTGNTWHHEANYTVPSAIIMGSEASGLSEKWLSAAGTCIKIPMNGKVDSLNVSASAAILVFEAMRQRGFICTSHLPA